jgi:hypothetical protein
MLHIRVDDQLIGIPGHLLAQAIIDSVPGFLTGATVPQGMQQVMIRSGVKNIIPLLLGMLHQEIVKKDLPIVPPDLRCKAAKTNIVLYGLMYLLSNATELAEHQVFVTEGNHDDDGTYIITGLSAAPAALAAGTDGQIGPVAAIPVSAF